MLCEFHATGQVFTVYTSLFRAHPIKTNHQTPCQRFMFLCTLPDPTQTGCATNKITCNVRSKKVSDLGFSQRGRHYVGSSRL
jgi:hypothetical protein